MNYYNTQNQKTNNQYHQSNSMSDQDFYQSPDASNSPSGGHYYNNNHKNTNNSYNQNNGNNNNNGFGGNPGFYNNSYGAGSVNQYAGNNHPPNPNPNQSNFGNHHGSMGGAAGSLGGGVGGLFRDSGGDFLSNPAAAGLFSAGQNILAEKTGTLLNDGNVYWANLKEYFSIVNHKYVYLKLKLLLYPSQPSWARSHNKKDDLSYDAANNSNTFINLPDLYVPLMSFVTYVLLIGLCQGLQEESGKSFSPDTLIQTIWRCLVIHLIESGIIKLGISFFGYNLNFVDAFAYCGYKYFGLCLAIVARLLGKVFSFIAGFYTSLAFAYFILKSLSALLPQREFANTGRPDWDPRVTVIVGISLMELVVTLFINYL